ncbi:lipoxygenase 1 [Seiridium cupressi]
MGNTFSSLRRALGYDEAHPISSLNANLPKPPSYASLPRPADILKHPDEIELFKKIVGIAEAPLEDFDPGVLSLFWEFTGSRLSVSALETWVFTPDNSSSSGRVDPEKAHTREGFKYDGGNIKEGTYAGTQAAVTQLYSRIEQSYASYFDVLALEPTLPRYIDLKEKREMYQYTAYPNDEDGKPAAYPPHLQTIPKEDDVSKWKVFNALGLAESIIIVQKVIPDTFLGKTADWLLENVRIMVDGTPQEGPSIKDCEEYNKYHRKSGTDIARGENIGLLPDWYSDRRFAEQSFTGTNPTTITKASPAFIKEFVEAAKSNGYDTWADVLPTVNQASLFMQDCSYYREAIGVTSDETLKHTEPASDENWANAPVTLYRLHDNGKLHPIAICIDYRRTMANSVTIFNRRMSPTDSSHNEATDWPWRYAKTAAQVADWVRHELTVHLTNSHFVEETIIVATNRTIPMEHIIFKTLHPHWYKTLSLNAAARNALVPHTIRDIVGFGPEQASSFIRHAFENYDFVGNYVPNQLFSRGFPNTEAVLNDQKYKNYPYAKNMTLMWAAIRQYVTSILQTHYDKPRADEMVAKDPYIADWCKEIQTAGFIKSFPTIKTFEQLVDAVTMCIHVAAPFHSAVNYLQNFYQAFVPAKPPCLCAELPTSLDQLRAFTERDMVKALPIRRQREWLLATQIPWLLSFRVASDRSLLNFALSQWNVYKKKRGDNDVEVRDISERFYLKLCKLAKTFYCNSKAMDEGAIPYMVMDPGFTAVSILI